MNLAVRFNARSGDKSRSSSRQRRLKEAVESYELQGSTVADATG